MLGSEFRHIKWICNAKTTKVEAGKMYVTESTNWARRRHHELPFKYT